MCGLPGHFSRECTRRQRRFVLDLLQLWKTRAHRARVYINASFKLLKDGQKVGGDRAHPVVSMNFIDNCTMNFIDNRALIDSGSMKSFISKSVQRTIDFDDHKLTKSKKEKCVSITGHTVNIQGNLPSTVENFR